MPWSDTDLETEPGNVSLQDPRLSQTDPLEPPLSPPRSGFAQSECRSTDGLIKPEIPLTRCKMLELLTGEQRPCLCFTDQHRCVPDGENESFAFAMPPALSKKVS